MRIRGGLNAQASGPKRTPKDAGHVHAQLMLQPRMWMQSHQRQRRDVLNKPKRAQSASSCGGVVVTWPLADTGPLHHQRQGEKKKKG